MPRFNDIMRRMYNEATTTGGGGYSGAQPLGAPLRQKTPQPPDRIPADYERVLRDIMQMMPDRIRGEVPDREMSEAVELSLAQQALLKAIVAEFDAQDSATRKRWGNRIHGITMDSVWTKVGRRKPKALQCLIDAGCIKTGKMPEQVRRPVWRQPKRSMMVWPTAKGRDVLRGS